MAGVKKILFISYDGMTDPLGQSQVIPYLQGLCKKGYQFHLLSCEKEAAFAKNKATIDLLLKDYAIQWHPIPYTKKPPVLSTLKDVINLRKTARQLHLSEGIDMVHTRPGIPALIGLWLKKKYGIRFLHDIREFYADSRVEGGIWNKNNPLFNSIYQYFKKKEQVEVAEADGLVCLTHAAEKITRALPEYKADVPLAVIPCSADLALLDPATQQQEKQTALRKELGISGDDFVLSYLGSIGGWYMTDEMMRFCKQLSDKKPQAKFLFISPHLHEVIYAAAAKQGLDTNKIIVKHGSRQEVPLLLSLSNYSLFFIKPCYSKLSSSPTKHGEIMAMGIPVITNSGVGDVKEIVEKYQSGFVVDDFSAASFDKVIDQLDTTKFNSNQIRQGATAFYALEQAIEKYSSLYEQVLSK